MTSPIEIAVSDNEHDIPTPSHVGGRSRAHTFSYPSLGGQHPQSPDAAPAPPSAFSLSTALGGLLARSQSRPFNPSSSPVSVASSLDESEAGPATPPDSSDDHGEEERDALGWYGSTSRVNKGVLLSRRSSYGGPATSPVLSWIQGGNANAEAPAADDKAAASAFGLFRRLSLTGGGPPGGFKPTKSAPLKPSAESAWPPAPPATAPVEVPAVVAADEGERTGRPFGRRGSTTKRKLSPMSEQMLRGHWAGHF